MTDTGSEAQVVQETSTEAVSTTEASTEAVQAAPTTTEQKPEPQKKDLFSAKFAALSRKEKAVREREAEILRAHEELMAERQRIQEEAAKRASLEDRLKKEPLKVIKELGLTFDDLAKMALNDDNPTPELMIKNLEEKFENKYRKELEDLRAELLEKEKRQEEERYNEIVSGFKADLNDFLASESKYELIRANDANDLVFDVIEQHFQETNRVLSMQEAADHVEAFLEAELENLLKLEKVKGKIHPKEQVKQATQETKDGAPSVTLSNALNAQAPNRVERKLSREESLQEAAKLLKWHAE